MNLRVARIREERSALVRAPRGGDVRVDRVCRQVIGGAVAAGAQKNCMSGVSFNRTGDEVTDDDSACLSVDGYQVEHLAVRQTLHGAFFDLTHHRLIRAKQQLLTRLTARVKRPRNLCPSKRSVVKEAAIFTSKWNALGDALVDDVDAQLPQPIHIRFARSV